MNHYRAFLEGVLSVLTWNNVLTAVSVGLVVGVTVTSYLYFNSMSPEDTVVEYQPSENEENDGNE